MVGRLKDAMYKTFKETPIAPDFFLTKQEETLSVNCMHLLSVTRPALPIILVPGIMAKQACPYSAYNTARNSSSWGTNPEQALADALVATIGTTVQRGDATVRLGSEDIRNTLPTTNAALGHNRNFVLYTVDIPV